jgi:hypothetical protein
MNSIGNIGWQFWVAQDSEDFSGRIEPRIIIEFQKLYHQAINIFILITLVVYFLSSL